MAIPKTQIGLQHLTGSTTITADTNSKTLGKLIGAGQSRSNPSNAYSLPSGVSLDDPSVSSDGTDASLTGVLQLFGDAIGKITGRANWSNAEPGEIAKFGDNTSGAAQNAFDIKLIQKNQGNKISLSSEGEVQSIAKQMNKVAGWSLLLSSSDNIQKATEVFSSGGSTQIHASGSSSRVKITAAASGNAAVLLSASNANGQMNFVAGGQGGGNFAFSLGGYFDGHNPGGGIQTPGSTLLIQEDKGALAIKGQMSDSEGRADILLAAGKGKDLLLSASGAGASAVYFSIGDGNPETNGQMATRGGGFVALCNSQAELDTFILNNNDSTSLVKAINSAHAASGVQKGWFYKQLDAVVAANTPVSVAESPSRNISTLQSAHSPSEVQVLLNGQLLVSSSDPIGGDVNNNDYVISGGENTATPSLKFGFQLEINDQISIYDLK